MNRIDRNYIIILFFFFSTIYYSQTDLSKDVKYHLVRCDDIGMCHSVNMALKLVVESGLPISTSVMFACPWYQEAVEILKEHPEVSVGIHLTLNAEWKNYRWGPVLGKEAVPSLVDSLGYFFPSRSKLFANNSKFEEIEMELRAQIDRATNSGIQIDYIDYHMGAAVQTLELRKLVESLAEEYELGIAQYFGEKYSSNTYNAPLDSKADSLVDVVDNLQPGINLQVIHIGLDTPEMQAMIDLNPFGLADMSKEREAELNSLLSDQFRDALKRNNIRSITYRDLIDMIGLENMKRPEKLE
ncbi:MAG: ChbG/HpnK family deacetylase [Melioribacteraceae bacterium]|nr:ChbG/HpnK family deacetylase [Melioribacteraceae bacterium]